MNLKNLWLQSIWVNPKYRSLACFFILAISVFCFSNFGVYWDIFIERDIQRALGWLKGDFYWPGPEMNSGNNLPGPFFYFLLIPPLFLGDSIYHDTDLWRLIWLSLTYTTAFYFTSKIVRHKESSLIFVFIFLAGLSSNIILTPLSYAMNPLFAVLFHVLTVINIYFWKQTEHKRYLYYSAVLIALGVQIHFLTAIHTVTVFILFCFKKKKKLIPILLFSLIAFSPFLIYAVMGVFYNFETSSWSYGYFEYLKKRIFSESWMENIKKSFSLPCISSLITLFFWLLKSFQGEGLPIKKATKDLFIITAIPSLIIFIIAQRTRYCYPIPVLFMLFLSKLCDDLMSEKPNQRLNFIFAYGVLLFSAVYIIYDEDLFFYFKELFSGANSPWLILLFSLPFLILLTINMSLSWKQFWKVGALSTLILPLGLKNMKDSYYNTPPPPFLFKIIDGPVTEAFPPS